MTMADPPRPKTIDMTPEGKVLAPPSFWSRARAIWRTLPRGTLPAVLLAATAMVLLAIFFLGLVVLVLPVILALALLALLARVLAR